MTLVYPEISYAEGMATVLPTVDHRQPIYDIARGFAVLGILLANIVSFSYPVLDMMVMQRTDSFSVWFDAISVTFVNGKFRTMLAILFGVGLYAQFRKRGHDRNLWPGGYLKRSLVLLALGTAHMLFIWYGDILTMYAITAMVVAFLVNLPERAIQRIWWGVVAYSLGCGMLAGFGLATMSDDFMKQIADNREASIFSTGNYLEQLQYRAETIMPQMGGQTAAFIPVTIALFLLGVSLARKGALLAPSRFPSERNWMLGLGFGLGLPLNCLGGWLALNPKWAGGVQMATELTTGPLLGIGYLMLLAVVVERVRGARWLRPVNNVGRMALTSYLTQSVLMTGLFYSWGAGWFGTVDPAKILGAVAIGWTVNFGFAWLWLRFFDIGPVEWVQRSLTEGRRLPWRYPVADPRFEA